MAPYSREHQENHFSKNHHLGRDQNKVKEWVGQIAGPDWSLQREQQVLEKGGDLGLSGGEQRA